MEWMGWILPGGALVFVGSWLGARYRGWGYPTLVAAALLQLFFGILLLYSATLIHGDEPPWNDLWVKLLVAVPGGCSLIGSSVAAASQLKHLQKSTRVMLLGTSAGSTVPAIAIGFILNWQWSLLGMIPLTVFFIATYKLKSSRNIGDQTHR